MRLVQVLGARPAVAVADVSVAVAFWRDVVGFEVATTMGDPPTFAMVVSGGGEITLVGDDNPPDVGFCPVFVTLTGLDDLLGRLAEAGVVLDQEPTTRPWGIRDIVVRCPGGGPLIAFGEQI